MSCETVKLSSYHTKVKVHTAYPQLHYKHDVYDVDVHGCALRQGLWLVQSLSLNMCMSVMY